MELLADILEMIERLDEDKVAANRGTDSTLKTAQSSRP